MNHFEYRQNTLHCENVALSSLAAEFGTPLYVYSTATLERHWRVFDHAFRDIPHLICYSVKANSNLAILRLFANLESGFDIVSGGELARVLRVSGDPAKVVFSGVGKTVDEIRQALSYDILCFNVESEEELRTISAVALAEGKRAPISLRVNPDVDAKTHAYISTGLKTTKFGIPIRDATEIYDLARSLPAIDVRGIDCHIGSQLLEIEPFVESLRHVLDLLRALRAQGFQLSVLDIGGGLGIPYTDESPPDPQQYADAMCKELEGWNVQVLLEPGRVIVGNAGILLTRVLYWKSNEDKHFVVVDAGMNDAMRPAMYGARHNIVPVELNPQAVEFMVDVVGPICESADFLGKCRKMPKMMQGELLAMMTSGAYGFSMASNYNSRPRAAEVLVNGGVAYCVRQRETIDSLFSLEAIPPFLS
ncbi:MAG: diaminopimelate decarboxylase [Myxococcales bacterium]|nr:diaminopimelate decarboxylase [Myxococcales bacterium]